MVTVWESKEAVMTHKLERIVIAVDDDGERSEAAIEHGLALATAEGARVIFAHVTSILSEQFPKNGGTVNRVPDRASMQVLIDALEHAREAGVPAVSELLVGYAPSQIAALADELDADLIIVGSRHMTGTKRMLHGSTSRALLDATRRPLLIVTEPAATPTTA